MKPRNYRNPSRKPRSSSSSSPSSYILTLLLVFSFVVLIFLAFGFLSIPSNSTGSSKPNDLTSLVRNTFQRSDDEERGEQWVELISWEPRAFIYHNLLSKEECDYLIALAKPHMQTSTVVDSETGQSKGSRFVVASFFYTLKAFIAYPEHGERLQVLHYEVGQKYESHFDYFLDEYNTKNGGQRMATLLMYLSNVEEGGETVFPAAKSNYSAVSWWNELSDCGKKGLSIKPKMGDALLFWNMKPDATLDESSLHGGCPVIKGNKWSSTKWMRVHEYKV